MVRWLNPNQAEEDETNRRMKAAQDDFKQRGLYTPRGQYSGPAWETETGHRMNINKFQESDGGGWFLSAHHPGDPTGTMMHAHLGHDDAGLYDSMTRVLRTREAMGHLMDMYQRARLNNDPTGNDYAARRDPRQYYREFHSPRVWAN